MITVAIPCLTFPDAGAEEWSADAGEGDTEGDTDTGAEDGDGVRLATFAAADDPTPLEFDEHAANPSTVASSHMAGRRPSSIIFPRLSSG